LTDDDAAQLAAAMLDARNNELVAARHLRRDVYEARAEGRESSYGLLFAEEGQKGRVLLALHAMDKKTQGMPISAIDLAERRLSERRRRDVG
jgi:phage-related protein